jgi:hypothetical protein
LLFLHNIKFFNLIIDSGFTQHMFTHQDAFNSYKPTPNSHVILADKSKVPCLDSGTTMFILQDKNIVFHDILHVPKLRSPLLSVQCFLFNAFNVSKDVASLLIMEVSTLPFHNLFYKLMLHPIGPYPYHFALIHLMFTLTAGRLVGSICNASEITRFHQNHRPVLPPLQPKKSTTNNKTYSDDAHPFTSTSSLSNNSDLYKPFDLPIITEYTSIMIRLYYTFHTTGITTLPMLLLHTRRNMANLCFYMRASTKKDSWNWILITLIGISPSKVTMEVNYLALIFLISAKIYQ